MHAAPLPKQALRSEPVERHLQVVAPCAPQQRLAQCICAALLFAVSGDAAAGTPQATCPPPPLFQTTLVIPPVSSVRNVCLTALLVTLSVEAAFAER